MTTQLTNSQILIKECIKQEFEDSNGYKDINNYFEHFAALQVLKNFNLNDEEIDNGNSGGGNDGGCDNLYIFLNDELITGDKIDGLNAPKGSYLDFFILQSKNTTSFGEDAIMKWKTISDNLLNMSNNLEKFSDRYNEATIEFFGIFKKVMEKLVRNQVKVRFFYYYITLGNQVHQNVKKQAEELKKIVKCYYPASEVQVLFITADQLMDMYNADSETSVILEFADQPISLSENEYISLVKLGTYFRFITDDSLFLRKTFFEANVRDYQGNNIVNSSIAETLKNVGSEEFWWLNNGVTILSTDIKLITNKSLQVVNPEIVNGLQTSREIYNYFSENKEKIDEDSRTILVRVIRPKSEESRDNIIFSTNNQTSIPKSSLRVTDTIHLQIEMYFKNRGLYYDRRKNYYKNQKKKAIDIISVSFLAQCLISLVLRKPDFARARPSTLLTDEETYKYLYETNQDLEAYYKAAKVGRNIQNKLKSNGKITNTEINDILFYVIYAVVANVLEKKEISFLDLKNLDLNNITETEIIATSDKIYNKYKELGGNSRIAKSQGFIDDIYLLFDLN
ncbi:AIPR family protein [Parvimonas micra]|uniref:AIPR family protein n=1 Tax=Parvimonas micra TaxID=33033 RepID=A0A9X3HEY0_9FIRM|nr:AIPR family protein [Parvimonas micra]MCZ7407488.1 AIPR family protein [Parvimonas micra]MCZ7410267.1 AIPR family protein [Parvimonas micra]MCZ7412096.1 AIPR family protein [Parvimonas micra]WBB37173.1 AIPR family protein [Parvimonas micra]